MGHGTITNGERSIILPDATLVAIRHLLLGLADSEATRAVVAGWELIGSGAWLGVELDDYGDDALASLGPLLESAAAALRDGGPLIGVDQLPKGGDAFGLDFQGPLAAAPLADAIDELAALIA